MGRGREDEGSDRVRKPEPVKERRPGPWQETK